jgi:4-hydroxythreonine-4-phosphate dehydrogenase
MNLKRGRLLSSSNFHVKRMSNSKLNIGITMGDPSGVGPEVIVKALKDTSITQSARIIVIGDEFVLSRIACFRKVAKKIHILDLKNVPRSRFCFGKLSAAYGQAALEYIVFALALLRAGKIDCLVTAPVNKESINMAGHKFIGHAEFLQHKTKSKRIAMMFVADNLRVVLVTRHLSLRQASRRLTMRKILEAISLTYRALKDDFKIKNPRIAVLGLNPHAGEGGILGSEEKRIIGPAIRKARRRYRNIFGPLVPDTAFTEFNRKRFDAVVAMYHDQGLIPLKTLCFFRTVNVTLGLPFVRTSPSHGTALDIAGRNTADSFSMSEAITLAARLSRKSR